MIDRDISKLNFPCISIQYLVAPHLDLYVEEKDKVNWLWRMEYPGIEHICPSGSFYARFLMKGVKGTLLI